jgi:hypothetical protein
MEEEGGSQVTGFVNVGIQFRCRESVFEYSSWKEGLKEVLRWWSVGFMIGMLY